MIGRADYFDAHTIRSDTIYLTKRNLIMSATEKLLYTGKTHVTSGPNGAARSSDGFVDIKLPEPHPAAEQLFAAAWSAC